MESAGSSSGSFVIAIAFGEGGDEANGASATNSSMNQNNGRNKEIEIVCHSEASSASATDSSMQQQNTERNNTSSQDDTSGDTDVDLTWIKLIILMTFSSPLALLTIPFILKRGILQPATLFKNPISFVTFLMVLMTSFFCAAVGVMFRKERHISKACNLISLTSVFLLFTLLLSELLPSYFKLVPWIFFLFTIGALLYRCVLGAGAADASCALRGRRTPSEQST